MSESEVNNAVQSLQNMWYLAAVDGLGLDKSSFMLLQPGVALPYTTSTLWQLIDSIPPKALTAVFSPGALNSFYQNYGGLFSAVIAPMSDDFRVVMGDHLSDWMAYKKGVKLEDLKDGGWSGLFEFWASTHLPDNKVTTAISVFNKDIHNIVNIAFKKYQNNSNENDPFAFNDENPFLYNILIDDIVDGAIKHGPKREIRVNSKTSSSDVYSTWAKGGASGLFAIFSLGGKGDSSKTTSKFASSEITIDATFQHVVTIQTFKPGNWYNSSFLNYASKGDNVFSTGNPRTWENTFGPDGDLQRIIEGVVVVDGIDIVMTSDATYSAEEQKEINAQTKGGVWPFFSVNASGGYSSKVSFNDQGRMTVRTSCPVGNPAIFGANVRNISAYITD
ncbi:hypothetical protein E1L25_27005 [Salmonella enterica subsp. enterica serovar Newport]|nr:hypothetical protein [Salmonella enterica subsp. enterica serovar Newport]